MATTPRTPRAVPARPLRAVLAGLLALVLLAFAAPASAQTGVSTVADEVASSGSYVEQQLDDELRAAIAEANDANIAVVLLDDQSDAVAFARQVLAELGDRGAPYRTVLVVSFAGAGAASDVVGDLPTILAADGPTFRALAQGRNADGIRLFTQEITGSTTPATGEGDTGGGDGGGFPWIALVVVIALAGVGFGAWWVVRERRDRKAAEARIEAQRAEIGEQLRNNADKVIGLGDRVLASGDPDLVDLYASASETYRDVSHRIETARTAEAVTQLDRRMDDAEWRLEVIEARLAGRTPPPPPDPDGDGAGPRTGGPPPPPPAGASSPPRPGPPGPPAAPPAGPPSSQPGDGTPAGDDDGPVLGRGESLFGTVLPPAAPSRLPRGGRGGRGGRRRGWPGGRR